MKKVNILGIGRCVIGHMSKYIAENNLDIDFTHYYLLNYETIRFEKNSKILDKFATIEVMPPLSEQWNALKNVEKYDIVLIEIFKPSLLYRYCDDNYLACFESYSEELRKIGFYPEKKKHRKYIDIIKNMLEYLKRRKKDIKIVFVNGELSKEIENSFIGSRELYSLIKDISALEFQDVDFLDMNRILESVQNKDGFPFEYAFPYIYLRKLDKQLLLARDTKHTIADIRKYFLYSLFDILKKYDFRLPHLNLANLTKTLKGSYNERAIEYLNDFYIQKKEIKSIVIASEFSLFVSYAIQTRDKRAVEDVKVYIVHFCKNLDTCYDLKNKFYFIRIIVAFLYTLNLKMVDELCTIGYKILSFSSQELQGYMNFALIWLDNIFLVLLNMQSEQDVKIISLLKKLEMNENFRGDENIEKILQKGGV